MALTQVSKDVLNNSQANITQVGTLANLTVSGNVVAGNVIDSTGNVRDFTLNTKSTAYTLVLSDDSKLINTTANVTIPTGVFSAGQAVVLFNNSGSNISVTSSATVYSAGTSDTGTRTLTQRGLASIVCVAANVFVISGAGLV
jgi:hypothetical protein